ncbi:tRNA (adenosine(37)-N6)-threonylcarbamoyltransferase complex ATPase subunit type 1 TsaE [Schaalia sp. 19OD2882]|uniref:tRNA (adenosine(37)-N6)-threonylcarbamoyltransferase complex ATPase subunit type 1 TsaE n=1 Tax=Schaalia sp. 19OD2882 TaxID=2794089 RepID=UPI0020A8209E|nr:tRNA (adenosine(37)-N6)-threonylcarbamoyltransferase complex ATPase subunit type 1 TsaE [Schaalia sp. 19OD2882]
MSFRTNSPDQTRDLGRALGALLRAGDLVMLCGGLGAGKTTFTQGLAQGLGVRAGVTSPTYIVARVHPSTCGGPDLIHADAYRITGVEDLETLDLDSTVDEAVTVVEWGRGKTEAMSESRLEVDLTRGTGGAADRDEEGSLDLAHMDDGSRLITLNPHGARWDGVLEALADREAISGTQGDPAEPDE